jgi:endonuclease/exonuclease/phosphatase family metal-dependent hydrolase
MAPQRFAIAAALILLSTACNDWPLELKQEFGDGNWLSEQRVRAPSSEITVLSQNLYVGADVDLVIRALGSPDPSDDLPALLFAIETLGETAYPARAEAIADAIARARPHAVGLQEVSEINIDLRPLGVPVFVSQDFLALLQDALARRGLHYAVAGMSDNTNVSLVGGAVRLLDHDVLLVDADRVTVNTASGQTFAVNLGPIAPGVSLIRGWVWAQTTVDGQAYTFATAHTESNLAGAPPGLVESIRAAQVGEMVATLAARERVILVGDLNDQPGSPMYEVLTGSGYTDTWAALRRSAKGLTCCHAADLSDRFAPFDQRIDYVFTRGLARKHGKLLGRIHRFGAVPADRLAGPAGKIWPSDHAGLVAVIR